MKHEYVVTCEPERFSDVDIVRMAICQEWGHMVFLSWGERRYLVGITSVWGGDLEQAEVDKHYIIDIIYAPTDLCLTEEDYIILNSEGVQFSNNINELKADEGYIDVFAYKDGDSDKFQAVCGAILNKEVR